jgi:hypothetical protein
MIGAAITAGFPWLTLTVAFAAFLAHTSAISRRFDRADYSVAVKRKPKSQTVWRWEISRAGRSSPIEHSSASFDTMAAATRAGKDALRQFLDKYYA